MGLGIKAHGKAQGKAQGKQGSRIKVRAHAQCQCTVPEARTPDSGNILAEH